MAKMTPTRSPFHQRRPPAPLPPPASATSLTSLMAACGNSVAIDTNASPAANVATLHSVVSAPCQVPSETTQIQSTPLAPPLNLPTPINPNRLAVYLQGYNTHKIKHLIEGFTFGFRIHSSLTTNPPKHGYTNHKSCYQKPSIVSDKIRKECSLGRIFGPHIGLPLANLILSPLALVPKKDHG